MNDFIKNNKTFILLNKMKPYHKSLLFFEGTKQADLNMEMARLK